MGIIVPAFGIAFAAFCVWLGVRIVNRRERWAKRAAIAVVTLVLYPLSFGPACWIAGGFDFGEESLRVAYRPLFAIIQGDGPRVVQQWLHWYAERGIRRGHYLFTHTERAEMGSGWDFNDILAFSWPIALVVSIGAAWIGLRGVRGDGRTNKLVNPVTPPAPTPKAPSEST